MIITVAHPDGTATIVKWRLPFDLDGVSVHVFVFNRTHRRIWSVDNGHSEVTFVRTEIVGGFDLVFAAVHPVGVLDVEHDGLGGHLRAESVCDDSLALLGPFDGRLGSPDERDQDPDRFSSLDADASVEDI